MSGLFVVIVLLSKQREIWARSMEEIMGRKVREAYAHDAPTIARNNIQLALETEDKLLDEMNALKGVEAVLGDPRMGFYLLVEDAGKIIGQCLVTSEWSDWRNGIFWWIQSVYVEKDWRGRGVFSALFEKIHHMALERGDVVGLRLYVDRDNATAREIYERIGLLESRYSMYEMEWTEGD